MFSSDDDVPLYAGQEDRRKVQRRDVDEDGLPGPNKALEYVPISRKLVDIPIYIPTPRDRPVGVPIMGVRPADDGRYDPILGEWPVEEGLCEANPLMRSAGGQTRRASPVETRVYKPIPRDRPSEEKPYGLRPRERLVEVPKLKGRPVDGWEYEPLLKVRPVGSKTKDIVPEERPVDDPKPMGQPVDVRVEEPRSGVTPVEDETYEPMPRNGPIADPRIAIELVKPKMFELTQREEGCDNQSNMRRPDGETSIPTTDGRPATGPKTIIRLKGGEADAETVPLLHKAPPPSEVPDWSDGEAMPLIIIDNSSERLARTKKGYWPTLTICYQNLTKWTIRGIRVSCRHLCRPIGSGKATLRICQRKEVYSMRLQTSRDFTCDRPGVVYSKQILPSPRLRTTRALTTRSSGH